MLQLKKFDPNTIGDDRIVCLSARRGAGKTMASKCICWYKRHIPMGIVMNGSEQGTKAYAPIVPDLYIFDKWEPTQVQKLLNRQKRQLNEGNPLTGIFIVMDDCAFDKKVFNDKVFRELCLNGRPLKCFFMMALQYCMDLGPAIRENIDYLIVFRTPGKIMRRKLFDNFFGGLIDSFPMFCNILDNTTENYEALVLDNTKPTTKLSDCLYWWKAKEMPPFKMGCKSFWATHNKSYDSKYYLKQSDSTAKASSEVQVVKKKHKGLDKKTLKEDTAEK